MLRRCFSTVKALPVLNGYRFQLHLPSISACWFTHPSSGTLSQLHQAIKDEDPLVTSVTSSHPAETDFNTALSSEEGVKLRINEKEITLVKYAEETTGKVKTTFLIQFLDVLYAQAPRNKQDLDAAVLRAVENFREETVAKVERLQARISALQAQISTLEVAKSRLDRKIDRRITAYSLLGLSFMTAQWSWFFYTIYMVEWLGWDLMEPLTYSVGQAGFLLGVWSFVRFRTPNSFLGMAERYRSKKLAKLARRNNLDLSYLAKLIQQRDELQSQMKKLTIRMTRGGPLAD
jgi:hypothetical protein